MSRSLYPYYEKELYVLRQAAKEFAQQYPATAGRLLLEPTHSLDPHVERLLEGFALLAGRVHHKIDDEFPELTVALLGLLYPHYLAPIPSFAVLQFDPDPSGLTAPTGFQVPKGTRLHTQPVANVACRYRTAYPVTLWPMAVADAEWLAPPFPRQFRPPAGTAAVLRIVFELDAGARFAELELDRVRLYLNGDPQVVADLYEALLNRMTQVAFRDPDATADDTRVTLAAKDCVFPVGFDAGEALLPSPSQALPGYRLLTEYFAFRQKFEFIDLGGFAEARKVAGGRRLEVLFFADKTRERELLEQGVEAGTFRLGCTPVVNLFEQTAEPVRLTHARSEYRIVPDVAVPNGMEVYSVESVRETGGAGDTEYVPFFGATARAAVGPGVLARRPPAGRGSGRPWHGSVPQPRRPGLPPECPGRRGGCRPHIVYEPGTPGRSPAVRRAGEVRARVGRPDRPGPLPDRADHAGPPVQFTRGVLAADLAPEPQPFFARRQ